ncbi:MAG: hypothetical protein QXS32_08400 [Candidatus Nezhaarchaeales archaeon]
MVYHIIGEAIDLVANGTGTINIVPDVDVTIHKISITSTGRVEINRIEIVGKRLILKGKIEAANLHEQGNIKVLEEPIALGKGETLSISLLDISGAANRVYVAVFATSA